MPSIQNEAGFDGKRSLLQVPTKPASLGIEAIFIFLCIIGQLWLQQYYTRRYP